MTHEEVLPHIRHWVEVYVANDEVPAYCGTLLWQIDETSIVVNGWKDADSQETAEPVRIADIRKIIALGDPPWLVESNKSAAIISASSILYRAQRKSP